MKKTVKNTLSIIFIFAACTEFQEPQIDQKLVEVFVPRDSLRTDKATQLFYWYHVDGAEWYELQIVTPSFQQINQLILDTTISGNKYEYTLRPGTYEWSIRAYNHSSTTEYTVSRLFIDSTYNLGEQQLILKNPKNYDTTNQTEKVFQWQALYNADQYHLEIWKPDVNGQRVAFRETSGDTIKMSLNTEGSFEWRVRGVNDISATPYEGRRLFLDTTSPGSPALSQPIDAQTINGLPIDFSWQRNSNSGSSVRDSFFLAMDSAFSHIILATEAVQPSFSIDTLSAGSYYWRVNTYDKAGNNGVVSNYRLFTLQ